MEFIQNLCESKKIIFIDYTTKMAPIKIKNKCDEYQSYNEFYKKVSDEKNKNIIFVLNLSELKKTNILIYHKMFSFYVPNINEKQFKNCCLLFNFLNVILVSNNNDEIEEELETFMNSIVDKENPKYYVPENKINVLKVIPSSL